MAKQAPTGATLGHERNSLLAFFEPTRALQFALAPLASHTLGVPTRTKTVFSSAKPMPFMHTTILKYYSETVVVLARAYGESNAAQ